jgi:hypothetical protein
VPFEYVEILSALRLGSTRARHAALTGALALRRRAVARANVGGVRLATRDGEERVLQLSGYSLRALRACSSTSGPVGNDLYLENCQAAWQFSRYESYRASRGSNEIGSAATSNGFTWRAPSWQNDARTLASRSSKPVGASWEGFVLCQVLRALDASRDEAYFWATHAGAELDLLVVRGRERIGFEIKRTDSPKMTPSMRIALDDLKLRRLYVVHAGRHNFDIDRNVRCDIDRNVRCIAASSLLDELR